MAPLTLGERVRLTRLALRRSGTRLSARFGRSPLSRWQFGSPVVDELLLVPQELRTADPSFADELAAGMMGLGGATARLEGGLPFEIKAPSLGWVTELHGFGWLRHLKAAGDEEARANALRIVLAWIERRDRQPALAYRPDVAGRRVLSWIANADFLLRDVQGAAYQAFGRALGEEIVRLAASRQEAPDGYPRLVPLFALLSAGLSCAGRTGLVQDAAVMLEKELRRQVLPDGGHVTRNSAVLIDVLLDLLPLLHCFKARALPVPPGLDEAAQRIMPMLRYMRLGDGNLARFNGVGATPRDGLANVLAYDGAAERIAHAADDTHYVRMQRGDTVLLFDVGAPPPLELAGAAHAGCLSFEMSHGPLPLITNSGAPGLSDRHWQARARGTAAHSTLVAGDKSSAKLVRHRLLEEIVGAPPIRFPDVVRSALTVAGDGLHLECSHNGYMRRFGVMHRRAIEISGDGQLIDGRDEIGPPSGSLRLRRDLPFAIYFHLHPSVRCRLEGGAALLQPPAGKAWRLLPSSNVAAALEEAVHFTQTAGPVSAQAVVLRGATFGETKVTWSLRALG